LGVLEFFNRISDENASEKEISNFWKSTTPLSFFVKMTLPIYYMKDSIYRNPETCLEMKLPENSEL
jgi:hypothetical protein